MTSGSPPIMATISGTCSTAIELEDKAAPNLSKFSVSAAPAITLVLIKSRRFIRDVFLYIGLYSYAQIYMILEIFYYL